MSTVLMGALTARREDAAAGQSTTDKAPAVKPYVDAFAALVPAEVLAINAVVLQFCTDVSSDKKTTMITEATTLKWAFVALLVLSVAVFASSRLFSKDTTKKAPKLWILLLQCLIPPAAFLGWSMLQPVSAFDVIDSGLKVEARQVIAIIGGVFLGILAAALGYKLDKEDPVAK